MEKIFVYLGKTCFPLRLGILNLNPGPASQGLLINMADVPLVVKVTRAELEGKISTREDMYNVLTQACTPLLRQVKFSSRNRPSVPSDL